MPQNCLLVFLEPNQGYVRARRLTIRVILLCFAICGTEGTEKEGVAVGLVTVHGSALGCRLWPVVADVLFDQLNRGFRQEEVNVHRLSGRTSLGELSPCVYLFTFTGSSNRPPAFSR